MINNLTTRNILSKLSNNVNILEFMLKLPPDDAVAFRSCLTWSPSLIGILASNDYSVFDFLNKLSAPELKSISDIMDWAPTMLARLRDQPEHLSVLHKIWDIIPDKAAFVKSYLAIYDNELANKSSVLDAFSQGQIDSKLWLIDTVQKLDLSMGRAWTLCGWIGTLGYLMLLRQDKLKLISIRSFDVDDRCAALAEILNRPNVKDNWKFKASTVDVNTAIYDDFMHNSLRYDGTVVEMCDTADTVINTSCDHMGSNNSWWERIPADKLIILQNNNWHENDQHNNSVDTIDEFKRMYPMNELLFAGEIDCTLYTRFMLIGRK